MPDTANPNQPPHEPAQPDTEGVETPIPVSRWRGLQRDLITGIFTLGPIALTIYVLVMVFRFLDNILAPTIETFLIEWLGWNFLSRGIPGLGLITLILLLLLTGFAARHVFGRWLIRGGQALMHRIPLVNRIYKTLNQISEAIFSGRRDIFKRAVLVPYPNSTSYAIGIVTAENAGAIQRYLPHDSIAVFILQSPTPHIGFLIYVPRKDVIDLDMSVEDALKLIISGGIVLTADGSSSTTS